MWHSLVVKTARFKTNASIITWNTNGGGEKIINFWKISLCMKAFSVPLKATEGLALGRLSTPFSVMAQAGHWDTCLRAILGWTVKATIALINYCFHKEHLVYYPLGDTSVMVFYLFFFFWGVGETAQTNKHPLFHHLVSEWCESIPCNTLLLCSARELACSHDTIFKVIQSSTHLPQSFTQTAATFQGVCIFQALY